MGEEQERGVNHNTEGGSIGLWAGGRGASADDAAGDQADEAADDGLERRAEDREHLLVVHAGVEETHQQDRDHRENDAGQCCDDDVVDAVFHKGRG